MSLTAPVMHRPIEAPCAAPREWLSVASHLDPKYGGIAAMLPELCAVLQAGGQNTARLLGLCDDLERTHVPDFIRDSTSTLPASRWGSLFDSTWRQKLAKRLATADVIHIHGLWEEHCVSAARASRALRIPYVLSAHGMLDQWALGNKRAKKAVYAALIEKTNIQKAACLHALTRAEAEDYRRFGATNPIAIIPNGVRVPEGITSSRFLQEFPHLRDQRIVLFLGRIHYKKGLDLLVDSWRQVTREIPGAHLVLAGPDFENTRIKVERQVHELGLSDRVTFTGMLSGPLKWSALAASELFVLPSYSEGFSMSVLEAMAMAKPVLVTRQCNVPEVSTHGAGWTIEPEQAALTNALFEALQCSRERYREMGRNGLTLVKNQFSWDTVGRQMLGVYEWILGGSYPPGVTLFH
jgi:glycosyltransferase involved in cell wall biosynthesis